MVEVQLGTILLMKNLKTFLLSCVLAWFGAAPIAHAKPFTLPVLPDTQIEVRAKPEMFVSQMNWLADNREKLDMPMVLHVGDIVDWNNADQWKTASAGFDILDKVGLPYALAVGNHDTAAVGEFSGSAAPGNTNLNVRKTDFFNSYFPISRLSAQKGQYEPGVSDNAYYLFAAGGVKWVVVTLEFCARPAPVAWANKVIAAFPDRNAIVLTHYHLNTKGEINTNNAGYGDLSPLEIFDQLKKNPNLLMVLSGHVGFSASRTDKGEAGHTIYQILQDYQSRDAGGGYIRLLEIDPEAGTIGARMYSPFYDVTMEDSSKFAFKDVQFIR